MASIIILAVVFVLDVLAFVLAIGAEKRRNTAAYVNVDQNARPYCVYGSDAATGYGIGALVLLAAGQAMIMVATRCFCCGRALSPGRWRAFAGFCFITCCSTSGLFCDRSSPSSAPILNEVKIVWLSDEAEAAPNIPRDRCHWKEDGSALWMQPIF
ncbi:hypothetical protein OsJ_16631 [Oryza sativa Japonica Group]|uniref:Uncharacterized protein n=1 Tax=Oryza sativa subsp. japonica TaxID=39947 RepID=A3AYN1_ORYSJ|nr:hypothetical protein OsJ_16631 [Oryza sativa Japonica Group]